MRRSIVGEHSFVACVYSWRKSRMPRLGDQDSLADLGKIWVLNGVYFSVWLSVWHLRRSYQWMAGHAEIKRAGIHEFRNESEAPFVFPVSKMKIKRGRPRALEIDWRKKGVKPENSLTNPISRPIFPRPSPLSLPNFIIWHPLFSLQIIISDFQFWTKFDEIGDIEIDDWSH